MAIRTYGEIKLKDGVWMISKAEPHVCIKLKAIFPKISKGAMQPFKFPDSPEVSQDLLWFIDRYPLNISDQDLSHMKREKKKQVTKINDLEQILTPDYVPVAVQLKEGYIGRDYQLRGKDVYLQTQRLLCGDGLGLGKTITAILSFLHPETLPAVVVVQTHLTTQWREKIQEFTNLKVHNINVTKPYDLPSADIYIIKYSCLAGWSNFFEGGFFKSAVFDEIQELRHNKTAKYDGGKSLSANVNFALGLTGTPVYNYGIEIFNIIDLLKEGSLGRRDDFLQEWTGWGKVVKEPAALGTYLRENFLFLRRTREDVGRELPPVNKIIHTVDYDQHEADKSEDLAKQLAIKVVSGASFMERGQAARDLDIFVRQSTGIAKARGVADYVRILLENNEPVLLAAWHRDVYDILNECLSEFKPVMYTGSESPAQKEKNKNAFINGETNLMMISLRSGIGLDGLQKRCKYVVFCELDWSPAVMEQVIARADRDGQQEQVTAIYLLCDYGSDPVIVDLLGLKSSQSHNIIDPLKAVPNQHSDESRIKILAESFLKKKKQLTEA